MRRLETQVVIAGAGPTGICAAIELARWGVRCVVVERRTVEQPVYPTANHLTPRSMEIFRQWGIADAVRNSGFPRPFAEDVFFIADLKFDPVATLSFVADREREAQQTPESTLWCPRPYLDPVLLHKARSCPEITLLHGTEIESRLINDDGVTLFGRDVENSESVEVLGEYLLVAEGASSATRDHLEITMVGKEFTVPMDSLLFRCEGLGARLPGQGVQFWFLPPTPTTIVAIDGDHIWRAHVPVPALQGQSIDEYLEKITGPLQPIAHFPWKPRMALATRYRQARAFLIGDAAHIVTPYGGVGMNTGIEDAFNIGWKLGAMYNGFGGDDLLDTYEAERRPCAEEVLRYQGMTINGFEFTVAGLKTAIPPLPEALLEDSDRGVTARAEAGALLQADRKLEFDKPGLELGFDYSHSPIIRSAVTEVRNRGPADWADLADKVEAGRRAPHRVAGEQVLFDTYGPHFTVVAASEADLWVAAAGEMRIPVKSLAVDLANFPDWCIIRPDGVVAACGDEAMDNLGRIAIWAQLTGVRDG